MHHATHILVIYGGTSTEREVSLRSGAAIHQALQDRGFRNTVLFDLTADNAADIIRLKPDLAFLALHGKGGEDGSIQGLLELVGIPYTGSGIAASALCMDKILTKQLLTSAGIPTAPYLVIESPRLSDLERLCAEITHTIGLPAVVKAPCQGSSVGVYIVNCQSDLPAALEAAFGYGDRVLVERYLNGPEITVPLVGNADPRTLPLIEITSENEFYDYEAKYTAGMCHHIIPARIEDTVAAEVCRRACEAYRLTACRGFARVDFIIDRELGPCVVEINTIPGMTEMSLVPDSARAAGISFGALVEEICDLALEGH